MNFIVDVITAYIDCSFNINARDIFTSMTAARRYVENRNVRPLLLLEEAAKEDFAG